MAIDKRFSIEEMPPMSSSVPAERVAPAEHSLMNKEPLPYLEPGVQSYSSSLGWGDDIRFEEKIEQWIRDNGERGERPVTGTNSATTWEGQLEGAENENKKYRYILYHDNKTRIDWEEQEAKKARLKAEGKWEMSPGNQSEEVSRPPAEQEANIHWYGRLQRAEVIDGAWSPWFDMGEKEDLGAGLTKESVKKIREDVPIRLKFMYPASSETIH